MIIDSTGAGATARLVQSDDPFCDTLMVKFSSNIRPVIANVATLDVQVTDIETLACATLADTSALANRLLTNANRLMAKPIWITARPETGIDRQSSWKTMPSTPGSVRGGHISASSA